MGLPLLSFAQPHVINPRLTYPDSPYVYIGVPNTLQITGTNKNLVLTIDNGILVKAIIKMSTSPLFKAGYNQYNCLGKWQGSVQKKILCEAC